MVEDAEDRIDDCEGPKIDFIQGKRRLLGNATDGGVVDYHLWTILKTQKWLKAQKWVCWKLPQVEILQEDFGHPGLLCAKDFRGKNKWIPRWNVLNLNIDWPKKQQSFWDNG